MVLGLATFFKGQRLMAEYKALGCHTVVVSTAELQHRDWPRDVIDELFFVYDFEDERALLNAISYLARERDFSVVVPLEEYVVEKAARVRAFLGCPGLDEGAARNVRDKLSMRRRARDFEVPVPAFEGFHNSSRLSAFLDSVAPPWFIKPRAEGGAVQIHKLEDREKVWSLWHSLGDNASRHLIEAYLPGQVYHVDSVVHRGEVLVATANGYVTPPYDVWHGGGVFASRTVPRSSALHGELLELNQRVVTAMGIQHGVNHVEFIHSNGQLYFLEIGARVAGAHLDRLTTAATGVNLFRESARLECAQVWDSPYTPPEWRQSEAGLLVCLTRDQIPDLSFADGAPEVEWRLQEDHHAGLVFSSDDSDHIDQLLDNFARELGSQLAVLPPADKPC